MRYGLRTLLILLAVLPPMLAVAWWGWRTWNTAIPNGVVISPESAIRIQGK
jgi:hypothetical protein